MTDTAKIVYISEKASKMNDVELMEFWLSLDDSQKKLFDNVSDFLQSVNVFK